MNQTMRKYAREAMESGQYFNNSGKRQKENLLEVSGACGYFIDEIVKLYSVDLKRYFSFWLYHGNPIAMYDHEAKMYFYTSCGWKTNTTKDRLNMIGANITQKNFIWYSNGEKFDDELNEDTIRLTLGRITGTGSNPFFAVVNYPDTGNWEDSPYLPEDTEENIKRAEAKLRKAKIKSYRGHNTTQNIFCMRRTVFVKACDYLDAVKALKG